jgi:hypothetical protein
MTNAVYTEELNTSVNFPNISIYNRLRDGVLAGYKALPNEGYVMYDRNANDTEFNPETGEEMPVTYYRTIALLPLNANFDNFPYVAVLRSEVDENYIFGGGDNNDHEIM